MEINEMSFELLNEYLKNMNEDKEIYEKNIEELKKYINLLENELEKQQINLKKSIDDMNDSFGVYANTYTIINCLYITLYFIKFTNPSLPIDTTAAFSVSSACLLKMIYNMVKTYKHTKNNEKLYINISNDKKKEIISFNQQIEDNENMLNGLRIEKEKVIKRIKTLKI